MSARTEGGPPLANMSAPPRSVLVVTPFRAAASPAPSGTRSNWGLAWHARVDFDHHLRSLWPRWAAPMDEDDLPPARKAHLRLCGAVALALGTHPETLAACLGETLVDDLMRLAPALTAGLPSLLMATPAQDPARPLEPDPLRALAILTHLSGRTCDPGGSPLFSEALREGRVIDLWTAEADHA